MNFLFQGVSFYDRKLPRMPKILDDITAVDSHGRRRLLINRPSDLLDAAIFYMYRFPFDNFNLSHVGQYKHSCLVVL